MLPDSLEVLSKHNLLGILEHSCWWVHPDTFRALPVWYPEIARGQALMNAAYDKQYENKNRVTGHKAPKTEGNTNAKAALVAALTGSNKRLENWACCHIWGVDDPRYTKHNAIVQDPRYFSCTANMVLLPAPLKGLTDHMPDVKYALRYCAHQLYGWMCDAPEASSSDRERISKGEVPANYPASWPKDGNGKLPPNTPPLSAEIQRLIDKRKEKIREQMNNESLTHYPREQVKNTLAYWKVVL